LYVSVLERDAFGAGADAAQGPGVDLGEPSETEVTRLDIFARKSYIGRIDARTGPLRFIPAGEAPEEEMTR
jgi:hypothetical protein